MSRAALEAPITRPSLSLIGEIVSDTSIVLRYADGLEVLDAFSTCDLRQYRLFFVAEFRRDDNRDGFSMTSSGL